MSDFRIYDLAPNTSHKSFYGKAKVIINADGTEILQSYNTDILRREKNGKLVKLYHVEPSTTTLRHIKAFCGLNKAEFLALA